MHFLKMKLGTINFHHKEWMNGNQVCKTHALKHSNMNNNIDETKKL